MSVVVSLHFATMSCNSWLLRIRFVAQLLICIAEMAAMVQEAQKAAAAAAQAREEEERQKTEAARIAEEQAASQRQAEQKQAQDRAELEVHAFSLYSAWTFIACMVFCQSMILAGFPDLLHARWQGVAGKICRCPVRSEFLFRLPISPTGCMLQQQTCVKSLPQDSICASVCLLQLLLFVVESRV